jgi:hypothetical protein
MQELDLSTIEPELEMKLLAEHVERIKTVLGLPAEQTALSPSGTKALKVARDYFQGALDKGIMNLSDFNEENGALVGEMEDLYPSDRFKRAQNLWAWQFNDERLPTTENTSSFTRRSWASDLRSGRHSVSQEGSVHSATTIILHKGLKIFHRLQQPGRVGDHKKQEARTLLLSITDHLDRNVLPFEQASLLRDMKFYLQETVNMKPRTKANRDSLHESYPFVYKHLVSVLAPQGLVSAAQDPSWQPHPDLLGKKMFSQRAIPRSDFYLHKRTFKTESRRRIRLPLRLLRYSRLSHPRIRHRRAHMNRDRRRIQEIGSLEASTRLLHRIWLQSMTRLSWHLIGVYSGRMIWQM